MMGSLQCVVENPLKYPKLTIVYLLYAPAKHVATLQALRYIVASTWQHTYIYIKEIRIHNK